MLTIDVPVTFTFNLDQYALPGSPPAAISLVMVDGEGTTTFDQDGITNGAVYTPPTDTVEGSYIFTYTFLIPGNWSVILAEGVAGDFQILHNERTNIIEGDAAYVRLVVIDPEVVYGSTGL